MQAKTMLKFIINRISLNSRNIYITNNQGRYNTFPDFKKYINELRFHFRI